MATKSNNTKKYWGMFIISLIGTIAFLVIKPEWFWVMLPFLFTSLIYAFDWA